MLAFILFLIAAWGWFCLVKFTDGAFLVGFLLIPVLLPLLVAAIAVHKVSNRIGHAINDLLLFAADWEKGA